MTILFEGDSDDVIGILLPIGKDQIGFLFPICDQKKLHRVAEKCAFTVFAEQISRNQVNQITLIFKLIIKFSAFQRWKKTPSRLKHWNSSLTTSLKSRKQTSAATSGRKDPRRLRKHAMSPLGSRSNL